MILPEKEWYSLAEVVQRWDSDVNKLIHLLITNKLHGLIQIQEPNFKYPIVFDSYENSILPSQPRLSKEEAHPSSKLTSTRYAFYEIADFLEVDYIQYEEGKLTTFVIDEKVRLFHNGYVFYLSGGLPCVRDENSVFIGLEEIHRYENTPILDCETSLPYLDPHNPHYSAKLAAAVTAWMAVYGEGIPVVKYGHKKPIIKWLEAHKKDFGDLSKEAVAMIATVVNANPRGGAPPQDDEHIWEDEQKVPSSIHAVK